MAHQVKRLELNQVFPNLLAGKYIGYDLGIGNNSVPSCDLANLFLTLTSVSRTGTVSKDFAACMNTLFNTNRQPLHTFYALVDDNAKKLMLMQDTLAYESGEILPVIFGSVEAFPLLLDKIIDHNEDFLMAAGYDIIEQGHPDAVITDLQNYDIPDRVYRHYKRARNDHPNFNVKPISSDSLAKKFMEDANDSRKLALIHTAMKYAGLIDAKDNPDAKIIEESDMQLIEDLYFRTHNVRRLLDYHIEASNSISNPRYEATLGYQPVAHSCMHVIGNEWSWIDTHRLRCPEVAALNFNVNDAILCNLIEIAKGRGATTFNLGFAFYPYKSFYKPEEIWRKGLRYNKEETENA